MILLDNCLMFLSQIVFLKLADFMCLNFSGSISTSHKVTSRSKLFSSLFLSLPKMTNPYSSLFWPKIEKKSRERKNTCINGQKEIRAGSASRWALLLLLGFHSLTRFFTFNWDYSSLQARFFQGLIRVKRNLSKVIQGQTCRNFSRKLSADFEGESL